MRQILGLGVTHYPGLMAEGNLCRRIKFFSPTRRCRSICARWKIGRRRCVGSEVTMTAKRIPMHIVWR